MSNVTRSALLSVMLIFSTACERSEVKERHFHNYEQLSADEPGNWIPPFIPQSAQNIRAKYKIDTGAELLTFHYKSPGEMSLAGHCAKTTVKNIHLPPAGFLDVDWWPSSLYQGSSARELTRYEFYLCEHQALLAIANADDLYKVFYWRTSIH